MTISKKAILGAIVLVVILAAFVIYITNIKGPEVPDTEVLHAAYPLYSQNIVWNDEVPLSVPPHLATNPTDKTIVGNFVSSQLTASTTNITTYTEPFRLYYDTLLVKNGWHIEPKFEADGPGSSVWGYTKENSVLIFSFTSNFSINRPNEPVQCPCTIGFSILGGNLE